MATSFEKARFNMIQQQIRPWDLVDVRVTDAMGEIPREQFVPEAYRSLAYADVEVPMTADGQSMLAPKVVARMLQALDIEAGDRVLEIGTGTGYATACLASLGGRVLSLEIDPTLADQARTTLESLGVGDVEVRAGDGLAAPVEGGPFDIIAVTGSLPDDELLGSLQEQLTLGGRLFVFTGEDPVMEGELVTRVAEDQYRRLCLFETSVPALLNVPEPERFVF